MPLNTNEITIFLCISRVTCYSNKPELFYKNDVIFVCLSLSHHWVPSSCTQAEEAALTSLSQQTKKNNHRTPWWLLTITSTHSPIPQQVNCPNMVSMRSRSITLKQKGEKVNEKKNIFHHTLILKNWKLSVMRKLWQS